MHNKQIIALIIIVISLGGALVMGFLTWQQLSPNRSSDQSGSQTASAILPKGYDLDFTKLQKHNASRTIFPYPVVNPAEVGTSELNNLIK